jgi:hypothetical protein
MNVLTPQSSQSYVELSEGFVDAADSRGCRCLRCAVGLRREFRDGHQCAPCTLVAMFTDDVVFLSPNEPVVIGKAAVRPSAAAYLRG